MRWGKSERSAEKVKADSPQANYMGPDKAPFRCDGDDEEDKETDYDPPYYPV